MRILIVEDNQHNSKLLQRLLQGWGEAEIAGDGPAALKLFLKAHQEENPYELIFLDINMPGMSGHQVRNQIRQWERANPDQLQTTIAMATSDSTTDTVIKSYDEGAEHYLVKPYSMAEIKSLMEEIGLSEQEEEEATLLPAAEETKSVLIPIADGVEEIETVTLADILVRAGAEVILAATGDDLEITASRGVKLVAHELLSDLEGESFDLIVLPGGAAGSEELVESPELVRLLRQQQQQKRLIGAICAAPALVLEPLGLIEEQRATCYPTFAGRLSNYDPSVVVQDGNLMTSQGPGTAMEFALSLVERLFGAERAEEVARGLLYQRP